VEGVNPCAEIPLSKWQTCCLSEIFLPNIKSSNELKSVATILYRICKHSLTLKCHHQETEDIVHHDMRIGIGITGYLQCTQEQKDWLPGLYTFLREFDIEYSRKNGFPVSIKLTTVKPSGTLSLLAGVTPGCHPAIFKYFIRRIRVSSNNPLVGMCRQHGYNIEFQRNFDGSVDTSTSVIEFPCSFPDTAVLAKDMTAIDQLEVIKELQTNWADNSVSCTIYYHKEELPKIQEWLKNNYTDNIKSCSFLLHTNHGFDQAPYSEITKEEYLELLSKTKPLDIGFDNIIKNGDDTLESYECSNGVCPVK
jgi:ribonucleotide reductase alpha subunit